MSSFEHDLNILKSVNSRLSHILAMKGTLRSFTRFTTQVTSQRTEAVILCLNIVYEFDENSHGPCTDKLNYCVVETVVNGS